jgi:hypothetical protein
MEEIVFNVFKNSGVYFCEKQLEPSTTSLDTMINCFEIFILEEGWLFYRLVKNCDDKGYLDNDECLIRPCEGYELMICMAKIFENDKPVTFAESPFWVEEKVFYQNRNNGTLRQLINEIINIDPIDQNTDDERDDDVYKYDEIENSTNDCNFKEGYFSEKSDQEYIGEYSD